MDDSAPLCSYLLNRFPSEFNSATRNSFLEKAGRGTLSTAALAHWLSQDRIYAQTYVRFIGLLLAKIRLPLQPEDDKGGDLAKFLWAFVKVLIKALNNIEEELMLFDDVAERYGLQVPAEEMVVEPITKAYCDFMISTAAAGTPILEGMVLLWGMEKCYYASWSYASFHTEETAAVPKHQQSPASRALLQELIPNWTSPEFESFVDDIEGSIVSFAHLKDAGIYTVQFGDEYDTNGQSLRRCEEVFQQLLWLEERFWPAV
ncbi:MAG: hypothetical protein M1819_007087 [Sarea resinae]|nr:MAG: hypothetical protein M1819_007087 [Sarea resinae]